MIVLFVAVMASSCGQFSQVHSAAPAPPAPASSSARLAPVDPATSASTSSTSSDPLPEASQPSAEPAPAGPDLSAYAGLGTGVDHYDQADTFGPQAFGDPVGATREMAAHGVRTLFLETGSYRHPPISLPTATGPLVEAAHAAGLKVVAWYLPLFRNVGHDLADVMKSIRYRSPSGQGFDGFALDIEADIVPAAPRVANLLRLSAMIRAAVGPDYALGAIIPSPRGLVRVPTYWPGFPYRQLPRFYDVILPMSYFTFHHSGAGEVAQYIRDNVEIVRVATGDPNVPIHVIGGIAGDMSGAEAAAFVQTARAEHVFGASLYEYPGTSPSDWRLLSALALR